MTDKKKTESKRPVQTVRQGAIGASIWKETAAEGLEYLTLTLSRSWASKNTGKTGYSQKFFAKNREELKAVIDLACDAMEELEQAQAAQAAEQLAA